ncbi:hypothetical protein [Salinisphaera sp. G21_0]|uniref:hypothetical protein n=1 Tax=Salinisphaera sp. G21_0 TaxID=2821094 RepID=UPI001ADBFEC2|nr:hypothetical protein [Salinisphaera sp. G21_0]MBO9481884.1 hypothetical protein [Salinisphaera sp. G21_0]
MDRINGNHLLTGTYTPPSDHHKAQRPLKTAQPQSSCPINSSMSTNLSERLISVPLLQPLVSQRWPVSSLQSKRTTPLYNKSTPRLSGDPDMTKPVKEFIRLWQYITETRAIKVFIGSILSPNRMSKLLNQLNKLTLSWDEQLQTLTNYYLITFGENPGSAIQRFTDDRKSVEHHLKTPDHPARSITTITTVFDQAEACINSGLGIKRHLTNLSQNHYSMSMDDLEHKELDECNLHLQTEYQKDLKISSNTKLSDIFSNDLLRGMNIDIYSPSDRPLLGIYSNTKTCSFKEREESGVIIDQMTFDTGNLTDRDTREQLFQSLIEAKLDKILGSQKQVHIFTFLCSQRSANIFHNLLNLYFIGKNLSLSMPERAIRTEARVLDNGDVSVRTILSLQKYKLIDSRSGDATSFDIEQMIEVEALSVITTDNLQPHFDKINVKILEPVSIQFRC